VRAVVTEGARAREVLEQQELVGRGDLDRLLTEWRSLLRQIASAPPLLDLTDEERAADAAAAGPKWRIKAHEVIERWDEFRALARQQLGDAKATALPELPPLTADQRRVINHRFFKAAPVLNRARGAA
jgi:hypothetical protein